MLSALDLRRHGLLLALIIVGATLVAGTPGIFSPWIQGDEFIFIVRNPDVTGDAPLATRVQQIFRYPPSEDLYQPLPILTYALQWQLAKTTVAAGASPEVLSNIVALHVRIIDLILHAANALLLWWVVHTLLVAFSRRASPQRPELTTARQPLVAVAWLIALLWSLHPVQVGTWAADMGRTHLLMTTFALLSLGFLLRCLVRGDAISGVAALLFLAIGMTCKVMPGWFLLVFVLEAAFLGVIAAFASWRVWVSFAICVFFSVLALQTTREAGLMNDAAAGLFGDPVARSAYALVLYFRNIFAPLWLSSWYLPDPRTGWAFPFVWLGLGLFVFSILHAWRLSRRPETRVGIVGWAWFWALLLPVIGLVGARESAAVDRYLYQPLAGLLIVVVASITRVRAQSRFPAAAGFVALAVALLFVVLDRALAESTRSTIQRADRIVALNSGDPRALQALANAYNFARDKALPLVDTSHLPPDSDRERHFRQKLIDALRRAAEISNLRTYFPSDAQLAGFHRQLAYLLLQSGAHEFADVQAQAALKLDPRDFNTWNVLAMAARAQGRFEAALDAYQKAGPLLPGDPETKATLFTNIGTLLLDDLDRPDLALDAFRAAVLTKAPPLLAEIGLAQCEIRSGKGDLGYSIIMDVLKRDPDNARAQHVAGEYFLKSAKYEDALGWYQLILRTNPTDYRALRGHMEACVQLERWSDLIASWDEATHRDPGRREFASFRTWALALASEQNAASVADALLSKDPGNPLACLAHTLVATRAGIWTEAVDWVRRAKNGKPVVDGRPFERAEAAIRLFQAKSALPRAADLVRAAIFGLGIGTEPARAESRRILAELRSTVSDPEFQVQIDTLHAQLSD